MPSLRFIALAFVLLAAACGERNPNFCEGAACDEVDASPDAPPITCSGTGGDPSCPAATPVCESGECTGSCTGDTDCGGRPASERVCHNMSGACVECDETNVQATPGQAEDECPAANNAVCDGDTHMCRPCEAHSECFSKVCDAGRCAPAAEIIYMSANGSDGGNLCDNPAPGMGCLTVDFAVGKVTATRKYILMEPSASPYFARGNADRVDINGVTVHIIGYGAEVRRNGDGHIIEVRGTGANVVIEGLKVANATNTGSGAGILMTAGQLSLFKAKIQDNAYRGLSVSGGTSLRITRSIISGNRGGGAFVDNVPFVVINNFISNNGDSTSAFGGVSLLSSGNTSLLEFNTVADNNATTGTADGVICNNAMVQARNNIIVGDATEPRVQGSCTHRNTLYGPDGTIAGTMNLLVADRTTFRFIGSGDYHLDMAANPASVAAGAADSSNLTGETIFDYDSQSRTAGGTTVDVGADEIP